MPLCPQCRDFIQLPGDRCDCQRISIDIQPTPDPEPEPQVSAEHLTLLRMIHDGKSRAEAEAYFGDSVGDIIVRHMLLFLGHRDRRYVSGWRVTERGRELIRVKGAA